MPQLRRARPLPAGRRGATSNPQATIASPKTTSNCGPWISPLPALLRGRRAGADELGDLRGSGARGVHVAFVLDDAVQGGQVLLQTNHPFALDGGTQQVERLDDAQSVVLGGLVQGDAVLGRFRHPLAPLPKQLGIRVLGIVEL